MRVSASRWLSYHAFLGDESEAFLVESVRPLVARARVAGIARRFFFIRYSEGGTHLRLRFMPTVPSQHVEVHAMLWAGVREFARARPTLGTGCRVEEHDYDRDTLYFGNTLASVYAELMNECSSTLALRILPAVHGRPRAERWVLLIAALGLTLRGAAPRESQRAALFGAYGHFLTDAARRLGDELRTPRSDVPVCPIGRMAARIAPALARYPEVGQFARQLARVSRRSSDGLLVAAHALHLLCNKLGLALADEAILIDVVSRLNRDAPSTELGITTPSAASSPAWHTMGTTP